VSLKTMMQAVKLSCAGNAEEEDSYSRRHEEKEVPAANMAPTTCRNLALSAWYPNGMTLDEAEAFVTAQH
jgi:hypothetical protein